jgi:putative membrane protein
MMESAQGGMAEVELGKLASKKGSRASVKQFGRKMVADHSKANREMKTLAAQKGVGLPPTLNEKDQAEMDRLTKLKGAAFDKEYMDYMTADHRQDVAEFDKEVSKAKDSDVKNFAAKTLPTLQDHLKMAEKIDGKVGGTAAGSANREK